MDDINDDNVLGGITGSDKLVCKEVNIYHNLLSLRENKPPITKKAMGCRSLDLSQRMFVKWL